VVEIAAEVSILENVTPMKPIRTLYICYFGVREPLVQTQVLPYLRQLAAAGIKVHLLTFEPGLEKWSEDQLTKRREQLASEGISWFCLPYHKSPSLPATAYDIMAGALFAFRLARSAGINVFHARAHIAMAMAMLAARFSRSRLIFDIRGLIADEYADAEIWKENSLPFKAVKAVERKGLRAADQIVVLTRRMRSWLVQGGLATADRIEVIPCCFDFSRFHSDNDLNQRGKRFEVIYAGSVIGLYMLEEMGRFFLKLREQQPGAFFRVLTLSSAVDAASVLRSTGLSDEDFFVGAVDPAEVPMYMQRARLGISFRKPTFSQIAASPTKIAEYLAAGLPLVCNTGIGDLDDFLERESVGVLVRNFDDESYTEAATKALKLVADEHVTARCAQAAKQHFDLANVGGAGYLNVYQKLEQQSFTVKPAEKTHHVRTTF
jgi:glycosyltransferase involved in cell wall biosynthesis